jgi:exopolysaccharide biosynthesis polyprenyl glycosylphosphotransferase
VPAFAGWAMLADIYGLYAREEVGVGRSAVDNLPDLLLLTTLATWLGLVFLVETGLAHPRLRNLLLFWISYICAIVACRTICLAVTRGLLLDVPERTLVIGAGLVGQLVGRKLNERPGFFMELVGYLDDRPLGPELGAAYAGRISDLERVVRASRVERVIVAFSEISGEREAELCRRCMDLDVQVDIVPRLFEVIGARARFHSLDGMPLLSLPSARLSWSSRAVKRTLDVIVAATSLMLLSPVLLAATWCIKRGSEGPVFFRQERMGAGGRRFSILKFRTMAVDADARKDEVAHLNKHTEDGPRMFKIPDDPRVTPIGAFLRRWSLDELPQLINVLRGEMSLVGPRPLILGEDEHIRGRRRHRLSLTPGITGLWQVLGRSDIPFAEMVTLDYLYVTNWSLWGDVKLLARTVPVVLQRRGAY